MRISYISPKDLFYHNTASVSAPIAAGGPPCEVITMEKREINGNFALPMPIVLIGAEVGGKVNFMPAGWCTQVNGNPPMILCALARNHHTTKGILETGAFSVNVPSPALLDKTDYCGLVSGAEVDKSGLFEVFYGKLKKAPMIRDCPVNFECRVFQTVPLPSHTAFIGEIVTAYADEAVTVDGKPDYVAINPLVLTMADNAYHGLGEAVGNAWSAGKALIQK